VIHVSIASRGDKKTEGFQLDKLIVIGGSGHPDFLLYGSGGQRKLVLVLVGGKVNV
jgi:hypothetical protein